jgi:hypothetical protein
VHSQSMQTLADRPASVTLWAVGAVGLWGCGVPPSPIEASVAERTHALMMRGVQLTCATHAPAIDRYYTSSIGEGLPSPTRRR